MHAARWTLAATTALLTGCAAIPQPDTVQSLTRPAIESAQTVVKHYNAIATNADRRLSEELITSVQTGDLLRQTTAAYKIGRLLKKPVERASTVTVSSVGAPEYGGYPMRFVASSNKQLSVWERSSAGAGWRLTFMVPPGLAAKVPDIGGVREIAPAAATGLVESPSVAATKFANLLTVGAKSPNARLFAPTPEVSQLQKNLAADHATAGTQYMLAITDTFTVNAPPTVFRTSSGEVLAFFTLTDANVMRPRFGAMWPVGQNTAAFSPPNHLYRNALTTSRLHQVAIAIPAEKGSKIRILGFTTQLVDSGGY